jgi:Protein of unknown function (DUF3558)
MPKAPQRRRRTASRPAGPLLACAVAVPALLIGGCSSGGGSDDAPSPSAATASAPTTAPLAPARYGALPAPCGAVTAATVSALVPKAKDKNGALAKSMDIGTRGSCSWTGNGKDGYQYRWLSVTLQRFTSSVELGGAEEQARKRYAEQVAALGKAPGVARTGPAGTGDQGEVFSGRATVAKVTSQNGTAVVRTGNVVLIVEFDGAGLVGKKNPSATTVTNGARRAAKDAVAAVAAANA